MWRMQSLGRQPGQVAVIMALAMTGLLGATALGIDLGFSYAHYREVQNAADAAALAGVQDLSRHYQCIAYPPGSCGRDLTADKTNSDVWSDMIKAAVASLPNFPDPATVTALPANVQLTAEYIRPDGSLYPVPATGAITSTPPAADSPVGVKATVGFRYPTFFARVFGITTTYVQAEAYAKLFKGVPVDTGSPFVVCGAFTGSGAYLQEAPPSEPEHETPDIVEIIKDTPLRVDYKWVGAWFLVHGPKLPKDLKGKDADCGHDDSAWKGTATEGAGCVPLSPPDFFPCRQPVDNGTRAGPIRNRVNGMPGCDPNKADGCVVYLPISNGPVPGSTTEMRIIDYAPFWVVEGLSPNASREVRRDLTGCGGEKNSNCHSGMLLPYSVCGAGCVPAGVFDPSNPYGITTFKLVESAASTS
jgi:hypothetical protein